MNEQIMAMPLFRGCNKEAVLRFWDETSSRIATYSSGDFVAMQGDPCRSLYLLCEGTVTARMMNGEGKELTIETIQAPEVLAPAFLFSSENVFPVSVIAQTPCQVCMVNKDSFFSFMQQEASLLRNFLTIVSDRSLFISKKLNEFALQDLCARLRTYLARHHKIQNLQEVSQKLGVARPSLSRAIASMVAKGQLVKEGNGYILKNG